MSEPKQIDFEVIVEPWNKYFAEGHGTIKSKFVLVRLAMSEAEPPLIAFKGKDLVDLIPLKDNKGAPDKQDYQPTDLAPFIIQKDIPFKPLMEEEWSSYKIGNKEIRFRLALVQINKTSKFDASGDPIYTVNTQPIVKVL